MMLQIEPKFIIGRDFSIRPAVNVEGDVVRSAGEKNLKGNNLKLFGFHVLSRRSLKLRGIPSGSRPGEGRNENMYVYNTCRACVSVNPSIVSVSWEYFTGTKSF